MDSIASLEQGTAQGPPLPPDILTDWAGLPSWMLTVDDSIRWVALATAAMMLVSWLARGRPDSLRSLPLKPNRVTDQSVVLTMLVFWLAMFALTAATQGLGPRLKEDIWSGIVIGNGAHIAGVAACLYVAFKTFRGGVRRFIFGSHWASHLLAKTAVVLLLALGLCPLVLEGTIRLVLAIAPLHHFSTHSTLVALHEQGRPGLLTVALWCSAVVIAPLAEECFFRGILQTFLVRFFRHRGRAILLSATLFAAVHASVPHTVPALLLLGVLLGYLYERTGSLTGPILVHALFNLKTLLWDHFAAAAGA